jgi:hypothetical protein
MHDKKRSVAGGPEPAEAFTGVKKKGRMGDFKKSKIGITTTYCE